MHDIAIETRLLVACIEEPLILDALEQLEIGDFFDWHHQALFETIRNLEAAHVELSIIAIDSELLRRDALRDTHLAEKIGLDYLRELLDKAAPYGDDVNTALVDEQHLRILRQNREAAASDQAVELLSTLDGEPTALPPPPEEKPAAAGEHAFLTMPVRMRGEYDRRLALANRAIGYHQTFIDDCLRAILPHDMILIGAESGLGKTDLALSIAMGNALSDHHVAYFALEAEPNELETRAKYSWLAREVHRRGVFDANRLNFPDWLLCRQESITGHLNEECDRWFNNHLGGFWTFYRNTKRFDAKELQKRILDIHKVVDLIVVDHLHYVDVDEDESENRAVGELMKTIRDVTIAVGKPIILVAHLRKKNEQLKKIVPGKDDFHGSSNIMKICTQAITIAPARKVKPGKWCHAPTYVRIVKDRRAGAPPFVALQNFDIRTRSYDDDYVIGRLLKGDTDWEPVKPGDQPPWARSHKQLDLEFV